MGKNLLLALWPSCPTYFLGGLAVMLVATTFACTFLVGLIHSLGDCLPEPVSRRVGLPVQAIHGWRRWQLLPLVVIFPGVGYLVDCLGGHKFLFLGILASAIGLAWLGLRREPRSALLAGILLSLAAPCVILPTIGMMPKSLHHFVPSTVAALNLGFIGISLGFLLAPPIINRLFSLLGFRHGILLLALLCLLPASLVALTAPGYFSPPMYPENLEIFYHDPRWWILGTLCFLFFPMEELLNCWRQGYLAQPDHDSTLTRTGYWVAFLGMRLVIGWVVKDQFEAWGLVCLAVGYTIILGNFAAAYTSRNCTWGYWLTGASFGPLWPTLLAVLMPLFPQNEDVPHHPATLMGLAYGVGAAGLLLLQPLLHRFTRSHPLQTTMRLSMVLTLVWAALALVLALVRNLT